jgi:hypothetical protein
MNAGSCLYATGMMRSKIQDVVVDGQDGTGYCWNGASFIGADFVSWAGGQIRGQNEAVQVAGVAGLGMADLFLSQLKLISPGGAAIHVGGGFGGLWAHQVESSGNGLNALVDTTMSYAPNRELFFDGLFADATSGGDGIVINDTLSNGGTIVLPLWVASACKSGGSGACAGVHVVSWPHGMVAMPSTGLVFNNVGPGVQFDDTTVKFQRNPATIFNANGSNCNVKWGATCQP